MKNTLLKKHHFWALLGLVPLFVLIAVVMITSGVGEDIAKAQEATKKAKDSIGSKQNPKSDALIGRLEQQVDVVKGKKGALWKANWDRQKDLYVWPVNSKLLRDVGKLNLKFGDPIPNKEFEYGEFRKPEVYLAEYSVTALKNANKLVSPDFKGMADTVAPTQFKDGWRSVLRHVNQFRDDVELTSEQVWLLMEDIWVQRSLLDAIRSVNAQAARFDRVKYEKDGQAIDDPDPKGVAKDPLRRKFRGRTWEVELEVVEKEGKKSLAGRLINHTDRLQLMGLNSTMVLKVWLQPEVDKDGRPRKVEPFEFKVGGEFVRGRGAVKADGSPDNVLNIIPTDDHLLPGLAPVEEIARVEQVFDTRTVPVKRIDALELGKTDSRYAALQANLKMPAFPAYEAEKAKDAAAAATALPGEGGVGRVDPGAGRFDPARPDGGAGKSGGGSVEDVVSAKRKRYVEVTSDVRRMPVGLVVVVDQAYQQDVKLALANSPLRFQLTQAAWVRFRGPLVGVGGAGGSVGPDDGGPVRVSGPGVVGEGGLRLGSDPEGRGFRPPSAGPTPTGSAAGTVSESQLTSGLVELSAYGIVSLYEQPPGPPPPPDGGKDPKDAPGPKK